MSSEPPGWHYQRVTGYPRVLLPLSNQLSQLAADLRVLTVVAVEGYGDFLPARRLDDRLMGDGDARGCDSATGGAQGDEGFGLERPLGDNDG